ncbi:MAG: VOC family protein [Saprospiraceae bacterium]|nr:VOC family protein [Saprospiraceae bacterium]MDP4820832.1 VOC family protein [Saprospiraceae bacterium]MDP4998344.1 VOC family protein [Saprospiraceae bacterium]
MGLVHMSPIIFTREVQKTVDFYHDVLGFELTGMDEEASFASLQKDDVTLMVSSPVPQIPFEEPYFSGSFYFFSEAVDELWEQCKDKAQIAYPIQDLNHGMREFAIYDNNGYRLVFGQELEVEEEQ